MRECFEVDIESLDLEGRGVAHREGKAVFVEGALPTERVRYELRKSKPRYETGRTVDVLRSSAARVVPRCSYFGFEQGACGGCAMQHLDPATQVAVKQRVLEDALWHLGRLKPERILAPILGPSWGYRHRARLSVRQVARKGGVLIGFHERASSYVADMRHCEILTPRVGRLLMPLRALVNSLSIRDRLPQIEVAVDEQTVVLVARVLNEPTEVDRVLLTQFAHTHQVSIWLQPGGPSTAVPLEGPDDILALSLPEFGVKLPFGPTDFTQVNHQINQVLVSRAVRLLAPQANEVVVDFFCGLGNFTLPLATRSRLVLGFEGSDALVARARSAAQRNGLTDKTLFEAVNLFEWTVDHWQDLRRVHGVVDRVLVDPPREGALALAQCFAQVHSSARPKRLVYVSCNPATLARDAAILVHEGGWRLCAAGVVNMFPHTAHVESMAVFEP